MSNSALLQRFPRQRDQLIEILHHLQEQNPRRFIDEATIRELATYLRVSQADLRGVVEYYSLFSLTPRAPVIVRVCVSPVCRMLGDGRDIKGEIEEAIAGLGKESYCVETTACLGCCDQGPVYSIDHEVFSYDGQEEMIEKLQGAERGGRR